MRNIDTFSKEKTLELKGIAILMMLFLHLFHGSNTIGKYVGISIGNNETAEHFISYLCNPVYAFTFLSGYGLYISYYRGRKNNIQRLWRLYLKYWVSLFLFVPIAYSLGQRHVYPGSWLDILENVTSLRTSYNGTIWFLFPYSCLTLLSSKIFKWVDNVSRNTLLYSILFILVTCSLLLHSYGNYFISHHYIYQLEHIYELLIPFLIGTFCAKEIKYSDYTSQNVTIVFILLLTFSLIIIIHDWPIGLLYPVYMLGIFLCVSLLKLPNSLGIFFSSLGQKATSMWFVHAYFCWYLFSDQLYSLKYSIFIYVTLIMVSYIFAWIVDALSDRVSKCVHVFILRNYS